MVDAINGKQINTAGIKLFDFADPASVAAEVESVQYEMTREMTRLIASKASQVQVRAELANPLSMLKTALANYDYSNAGETFSPELASALERTPNSQDMLELQNWFVRNGGYLGTTSSEKAQWKTLLNTAGIEAPSNKVPVYISMSVTVYDQYSQAVSSTESGELVWLDADQRAALADTLNPTAGYNVPGMERLEKMQSESVDGGGVRIVDTTAYCMDMASGPHLSQQEFDALSETVDNSYAQASTVLRSDSLQLKIQNANLLNILESGAQMVKDRRTSRERAYEGVLIDEQVRAAQQDVQQRWRDRQSASPSGVATGQAPVPGSLRTASFPTHAPDLKDDDAALRPFQPNI